jgi:PAS domain S-box-containing protein
MNVRRCSVDVLPASTGGMENRDVVPVYDIEHVDLTANESCVEPPPELQWVARLSIPVVTLNPFHNYDHERSPGQRTNGRTSFGTVIWNQAMVHLSGWPGPPSTSSLPPSWSLADDSNAPAGFRPTRPDSTRRRTDTLELFGNVFTDDTREIIFDTFDRVLGPSSNGQARSVPPVVQEQCRATLHCVDGTLLSVVIKMTRQYTTSFSFPNSDSTSPAFYVVCFVEQDVSSITERDASSTSMASSAGSISPSDSGCSAASSQPVSMPSHELRSLLDTANVLIFGVDESFRVTEWNEKAAEIFDSPCSEALGQPFIETYIAPWQQSKIWDILDSALRGRATTSCDLEIWTKSDDVLHLVVSATSRRSAYSVGTAGSPITGVVVIAQDVTESTKHERGVAAMANELRQLINTANAPIFGIDCAG